MRAVTFWKIQSVIFMYVYEYEPLSVNLREVSQIDFVHKKRQLYVWGWGVGGYDVSL